MSLVTTTKTLATRRGRRIVAAVSALALPVVLSGCAVFSPMATENMYNPGDGTNVSLGDVEIRDILLLGSEQDGPARIIAYVVNNGTEPVTVDFTGAGGSASVEVEPQSAKQISAPGEEGVSLDALGVAPGAMVPLQVQAGDSAPAEVSVPSVSAENPMYADYSAQS